MSLKKTPKLSANTLHSNCIFQFPFKKFIRIFCSPFFELSISVLDGLPNATDQLNCPWKKSLSILALLTQACINFYSLQHSWSYQNANLEVYHHVRQTIHLTELLVLNGHLGSNSIQDWFFLNRDKKASVTQANFLTILQ